MSKVIMHTPTSRVLHWVNASSIFLLTFSGLYINAPLNFTFFSSMDSARAIHFIFMWILTCGVIYRILYAFIKKDDAILFKPKDVKGFPSLVKYYLFMANSHPDYGKYNPGQKMIYTLWPILILGQLVTGLLLYLPNSLMGMAQTLGGIALMRIIHYAITWVFICTVAAHVYLSFINGLAVVKSIFTGYLPAEQGHGLEGQPSLVGAANSSSSTSS